MTTSVRNVVIVFPILIVVSFVLLLQNTEEKTVGNATTRSQQHVSAGVNVDTDNIVYSEHIALPLTGSAPVNNVQHTIPIEEIRQGCFRQDCIPSIDHPEFIDVVAAAKLLPPEAIGIALTYKGVERFYPFPMLETHELVNDIVAGDPLLISYCPLCGTGIVFERTLNGAAVEFGVSGMLWQSNLLMYNRAEKLEDRNLWSQVLGQAVVGTNAGDMLTIIPSDITQFAEWSSKHPDGEVLNGNPRDPYNGAYFRVARQFAPDFDESDSPLQPDAYVYGIEIHGIHKAYLQSALPEGTTTDVVGDDTLIIQNVDGKVSFNLDDGSVVPDVEGFWFSWKAAHPDTLLWK